MTFTFVSARFLVSLRTTGCLLNIFFSQHSVVLREISGREYERITNSIFMNLSHMSCVRITDVKKIVRVLHRKEGFARICHICEKSARILHRYDKYLRMFHTCDRFVLLSHSNESVTRVKNSNVFVTHVKMRTNSSHV